MVQYKHPIREAKLHTFEGLEEAKGTFITRLYPYDLYPIFFIGNSYEKSKQNALDFIEETIKNNESKYNSRKQAQVKAAETRRKNKIAVR